MPKLPDYREIETSVSVANVKDQIIALLYAAGVVHDDEDVIDVEIIRDFRGETQVPIKIKIKKNQPVEVIEHVN